MKQFITHPATWLLTYFLLIVLTFGHAFNEMPLTEKAYFAGEEYTIHNGVGFRSGSALFCAIAWPLYWSAQFFKK